MASLEIVERVKKALADIRPFLNSDGGDISFVELTDEKVVKIQFEGACLSCNINQMTLKAGVEEAVKKAAPEVKAVVHV